MTVEIVCMNNEEIYACVAQDTHSIHRQSQGDTSHQDKFYYAMPQYGIVLLLSILVINSTRTGSVLSDKKNKRLSFMKLFVSC